MNEWIELKRDDGTRFLFHINSSWEINDRGDKPAWWSNYVQGRNFDCSNTYEEIKLKYGVNLETMKQVNFR